VGATEELNEYAQSAVSDHQDAGCPAASGREHRQQDRGNDLEGIAVRRGIRRAGVARDPSLAAKQTGSSANGRAARRTQGPSRSSAEPRA